MRAGHEVLMEFNDNILLIVGNRQGILDQQISPHPIGLLDSIFIIIITMNFILFNDFKN